MEDLVADERRSFRFDDGGERARLDQFLAATDLDVTRSQLKRMIEAGDVRVNGVPARPGLRLKPGDVVDVTLRPPAPARAVAQEIPLEILYEDEHLIAVNKPAGLVVHPAPGHPDRTLVNALLAHCTDLSGVGGELRPGIVHRLDKDTSGVIVATKSDAAHHALVQAFKTRALRREYLAVVAPAPAGVSGTIDTLYGRHPVHRKRFSSKVERGKRAVTRWEVVERFGREAALVRCRLATGRTHQIRVHMADAGTPVLGDPVYGRTPRSPRVAALARELGRQALHAAVLELQHPITGAPISLETPPPGDMQRLIRALREQA